MSNFFLLRWFRMAKTGKIGWLVGLVMGTAVGMLFAPRKGKDLRNEIKKDRQKGKLGIAPLTNDIKDLGQELGEVAKDIYESDKVQNAVEKGKEKFSDIADDVMDEKAMKERWENGKDLLQRAKNGLNRAKKSLRDSKIIKNIKSELKKKI